MFSERSRKPAYSEVTAPNSLMAAKDEIEAQSMRTIKYLSSIEDLVTDLYLNCTA